MIREVRDANPTVCDECLRQIVAFIAPHGVVVNGVYKHFKGDYYKVIGFVRPSDDWHNLHVKYVKMDNIEHESSRSVADFLSIVNGQSRFKLMKVL